MSRHLASLALSATLSLMSSAVFAQSAEWTDPACSFVDKEMVAALHFENVKPSVERKEVAGTAGSPATTLTTCTVKFAKDGVDRQLFISVQSTSPEESPPPLPMCVFKSLFWHSGTICRARTKSEEFIAILVENKSSDETKRLHDVFRGHFERRFKELNPSAAFAEPAEWTDPACNFADKEMLVALHFENLKPSVERGGVAGTAGSPATKGTKCGLTSTQDGVIRALNLTSWPVPAGAAMPPNCSTQTMLGMLMTDCLAKAKGEMVSATLMEKNDDEGKRRATALREHFERRIKELNK